MTRRLLLETRRGRLHSGRLRSKYPVGGDKDESRVHCRADGEGGPAVDPTPLVADPNRLPTESLEFVNFLIFVSRVFFFSYATTI